MAATLILNAVIACLGIALIVGACLRWQWLVDPPVALVPITWLNRMFGPIACVIYNCLLGTAIVALAIWGSWLVCCR